MKKIKTANCTPIRAKPGPVEGQETLVIDSSGQQFLQPLFEFDVSAAGRVAHLGGGPAAEDYAAVGYVADRYHGPY